MEIKKLDEEKPVCMSCGLITNLYKITDSYGYFYICKSAIVDLKAQLELFLKNGK